MANIKEKFTVIEKFPQYSVSNTGLIKINKSNKLKKVVVEYHINKYGVKYPERVRVSLTLNKKLYFFSVHQLVMDYFGPPKPHNRTIDHRDRNPCNNNISNLRWASWSEQNKNRCIAKNNGNKICLSQIEEMYIMSSSQSLQKIGDHFGINRSAVWVLLKFIHPKY